MATVLIQVMMGKKLKFRMLIKYICINDLVHLEASFVIFAWCQLSYFKRRKLPFCAYRSF